MRLLLLLILVFCPFWGYTQTKFDYNWIFGYPSDPNFPLNPFYNGSQIDFNSVPESYNYFDIPVAMEADAAISDSIGHLLFYTNGCVIINKNHQIMDNGADLNQGGLEYEQSCRSSYPWGYATHQGAMILPYPGHSEQYVLLHLHRSSNDDKLIHELLYTVVDMSQGGGLGAVTAKNQMVFQDTFADMLTAVRHANGRDWWIVLPKFNSPIYYVFLLSPEGIGAPLIQHNLGVPIVAGSWGNQAVFSPNGKKYANLSTGAGLQVFDFNRCTGRMSHSFQIPFPSTVAFAAGVAFSPNSRYLYASATDHLYQFDFKTEDFVQSKTLIGVYDGFVDPDPVAFYQMMTTPDGRIFMTAPNGSNYLHAILHPNEKGQACNFAQHSIKLPTPHFFSIPNFPHFRLFDVPGSPCDTLGIDGPQPPEDTVVVRPPLLCAGSVGLYPNPASTMTNLELPDCHGGTLTVYDVMGRQVQVLSLAAGVITVPFDVSHYAAGVYLLRIRLGNGETVVRSLAVVR